MFSEWNHNGSVFNIEEKNILQKERKDVKTSYVCLCGWVSFYFIQFTLF